MNARHAVVTVVVTMVLTAAGGPTVVGAADDETSLGVAVEEGEAGATLLTVTSGGSPVANATVTVSMATGSTENGSEGSDSAYSGVGDYRTGEDGTVSLPPPNGTATVEVTAADEEETVTETVELVPREGRLVVELGRHADGAATATVTADGAPVSNATLTVAADGTYAGAGNYTTGENGSVTLPAPAETTVVTLSASADGLAGETSATLYDGDLDVAVAGATEGESTVRVSRNGSAVPGATVTVEAAGRYAGGGSYETGPGGTVSLPSPEEPLSATVVAAEGNESATTTVTLGSEAGERMSFGMQVSSFVHGLLDDDPAGGIGQQVSTWVRENNPGKAEAEGHAKHARRGGPPDHAKSGGPPDHAGNDAKQGGDRGTEKGSEHPGKGPGAKKDGNGNGADGANGKSDDEKRGSGKNDREEKGGGNGNAESHGPGAVGLGPLFAA